jgi:hypothetical protein
MGNAEADLPQLQGRLPLLGKRATQALSGSVGVVATACKHRETDATRETPAVVGRAHQLEIREDQAGPFGVAGGPLYRRSRVMPVEGRGLSSG